MALQTFNIENLSQIDNGIAGAIINAAIKEAVTDLEDRGKEDKKARRIEIGIELQLTARGEVDVSVEAHARIPKRRSASTRCAVRQDGKGPNNVKLVFQAFDPDNPNQRTIDEIENIDPDTGEVRNPRD